MKITDKTILEIYNKGWNDENNIYTNKIKADTFDIPILQTAYDYGRLHFKLGDDFPEYDNMNNKTILKIIKDE